MNKNADVVTQLIAIFKKEFGGFFKEYYEGDPLQIPVAAFPCMIVQKTRARVSLDATQTDLLESEVTISIVYNKADDFGAQSNVKLTEQILREKVEGRNAITGQFAPDTVMHVLRTNITLGQTKLSMSADWEYSYVERVDSMLTSEATVQLVSRERIMVPNRT